MEVRCKQCKKLILDGVEIFKGTIYCRHCKHSEEVFIVTQKALTTGQIAIQ